MLKRKFKIRLNRAKKEKVAIKSIQIFLVKTNDFE